MTEPELACATMVTGRAIRLQYNDGVCTHYGAEFECRMDEAIRVVLRMINFVTQLWAAAERGGRGRERGQMQ